MRTGSSVAVPMLSPRKARMPVAIMIRMICFGVKAIAAFCAFCDRIA